MTVADYILAAAGAALCLFGCAVAALLSLTSYLAPVPGPADLAASRKGCIALGATLVASAYFVGVIICGSWSWL